MERSDPMFKTLLQPFRKEKRHAHCLLCDEKMHPIGKNEVVVTLCQECSKEKEIAICYVCNHIAIDQEDCIIILQKQDKILKRCATCGG
jgi:hypothetical protein